MAFRTGLPTAFRAESLGARGSALYIAEYAVPACSPDRIPADVWRVARPDSQAVVGYTDSNATLEFTLDGSALQPGVAYSLCVAAPGMDNWPLPGSAGWVDSGHRVVVTPFVARSIAILSARAAEIRLPALADLAGAHTRCLNV